MKFTTPRLHAFVMASETVQRAVLRSAVTAMGDICEFAGIVGRAVIVRRGRSAHVLHSAPALQARYNRICRNPLSW
jgi:hypothetical protein